MATKVSPWPVVPPCKTVWRTGCDPIPRTSPLGLCRRQSGSSRRRSLWNNFALNDCPPGWSAVSAQWQKETISKPTRGNVERVHGGDLVVAESDVRWNLIVAAPQLRAPLVRDGGHGLPGHAVRSEMYWQHVGYASYLWHLLFETLGEFIV